MALRMDGGDIGKRKGITSLVLTTLSMAVETSRCQCQIDSGNYGSGSESLGQKHGFKVTIMCMIIKDMNLD